MDGFTFLQRTDTRANIAALIAGAGINARQGSVESDGGRYRIGAHLVNETDVQTASVSSAGTTTLALKAQCATHIATVTASAGSGTFTRKIVLPRTAAKLTTGTLDPVIGDTITLRLVFPASTNPTLAVYENTDSGTLLATIAGTGTAFARTLEFHYTGSAWVVLNEGTTSGGSVAGAQLATGSGTLTKVVPSSPEIPASPFSVDVATGVFNDGGTFVVNVNALPQVQFELDDDASIDPSSDIAVDIGGLSTDAEKIDAIAAALQAAFASHLTASRAGTDIQIAGLADGPDKHFVIASGSPVIAGVDITGTDLIPETPESGTRQITLIPAVSGKVPVPLLGSLLKRGLAGDDWSGDIAIGGLLAETFTPILRIPGAQITADDTCHLASVDGPVIDTLEALAPGSAIVARTSVAGDSTTAADESTGTGCTLQLSAFYQ